MNMTRSIAGALLLLFGMAQARADADSYRFDPVHTQVLFCTSHHGFSHPCGRLHVSGGSFRFDAKDWSSAEVDVAIDIASLDLGDAAWEKQVKSSQFLDAEKYPTARFISQRVEKSAGNGSAQNGVIHGRLWLHGRMRDVDLPIVFNKLGVNPYTFKATAGFSATLKIRRSDFGIDRYLDVVGDEVELRIEVEGLRDRHAGESALPAPAANSEMPTLDSAPPEEHAHADTQH